MNSNCHHFQRKEYRKKKRKISLQLFVYVQKFVKIYFTSCNNFLLQSLTFVRVHFFSTLCTIIDVFLQIGGLLSLLHFLFTLHIRVTVIIKLLDQRTYKELEGTRLRANHNPIHEHSTNRNFSGLVLTLLRTSLPVIDPTEGESRFLARHGGAKSFSPLW